MSEEISLKNDSIKEKLSSVKHIVRSFELRLEGNVWSSKGDKFTYNGNALCSSSCKNKLIGLLEPFAQDINLITSKEPKTFFRQKWETNSACNSILLTERGCRAENYKVIMKMFKNTLQNIGDIILGSQNVVRHEFNQNEEQNNLGGA